MCAASSFPEEPAISARPSLPSYYTAAIECRHLHAQVRNSVSPQDATSSWEMLSTLLLFSTRSKPARLSSISSAFRIPRPGRRDNFATSIWFRSKLQLARQPTQPQAISSTSASRSPHLSCVSTRRCVRNVRTSFVRPKFHLQFSARGMSSGQAIIGRTYCYRSTNSWSVFPQPARVRSVSA